MALMIGTEVVWFEMFLPYVLHGVLGTKEILGSFKERLPSFQKKKGGETAIKLVIWLSYGNFEIAKLCMYLVVFMEECLCWSRVGGIVFLGLN